MAKWPGSGLYYHAEVISLEVDSVEVLYSDGTTMEIPLKFIKVGYSLNINDLWVVF